MFIERTKNDLPPVANRRGGVVAITVNLPSCNRTFQTEFHTSGSVHQAARDTLKAVRTQAIRWLAGPTSPVQPRPPARPAWYRLLFRSTHTDHVLQHIAVTQPDTTPQTWSTAVLVTVNYDGYRERVELDAATDEPGAATVAAALVTAAASDLSSLLWDRIIHADGEERPTGRQGHRDTAYLLTR